MVEIDCIVLSQYGDGLPHKEVRITPRVQRLRDNGYLEISQPIVLSDDGTIPELLDYSVKITLKGKDALYIWYDSRSKYKQEISDKRKDRVFTALLTVLMFILGVIADHASEIFISIVK